MNNYENKISQETIDAYTSRQRKITGSVGQYFSKGFEIFQKNMGGNFINGVILTFLGIVAPFLQSGYFTGLYEERINNKPMDVGAMFKGFDLAGKIVYHYLASLLLGLVMSFFIVPIIVLFAFLGGNNPEIAFFGIGLSYLLMFLMIPIVMGLLLLSVYIMTFSKLDGMASIKASIAIGRKNLGKVTAFAFIMFILQFVGAMMCYVGAFVATPVSMIALYLMCNDIFGVESAAGKEGNENLDLFR